MLPEVHQKLGTFKIDVAVSLGPKWRKSKSVGDPGCAGPVLWQPSWYEEDECGSHGESQPISPPHTPSK